MFAARVVEAIDVFEEGDLDVASGVPFAPPDQFGLQGLEEALDGRVIIAVALPLIDTLNPFLHRSFW